MQKIINKLKELNEDANGAIAHYGELILAQTSNGLYLFPETLTNFTALVEEYQEDEKEGILDIEMLEPAICNGWEFITNLEIGAMVGDEMIIIATDTQRDEDGELLDSGDCYFDGNYAYSFLWERILRDGFAYLEKLK